MYFPAIHDERTTLRNYMQVQLQAIRDTAYGLTDAQARRQPLASVFSVSGVIKHCSYVLRSRLAAAGVLDAKPGYEDFMASFAPDENEDLTTLLEDYDRLCEQYLKLVEETDLDQVVQAPPAPWYGGPTRQQVRHALEEMTWSDWGRREAGVPNRGTGVARPSGHGSGRDQNPTGPGQRASWARSLTPHA